MVLKAEIFNVHAWRRKNTTGSVFSLTLPGSTSNVAQSMPNFPKGSLVKGTTSRTTINTHQQTRTPSPPKKRPAKIPVSQNTTNVKASMYSDLSTTISGDMRSKSSTSKAKTDSATKYSSNSPFSDTEVLSPTKKTAPAKQNNTQPAGSYVGPDNSKAFAAIVAKCEAEGSKYVDPDFPCSETSLYKNTKQPPQGWPKITEWKRITDICVAPVMFADGIEPGDIIQGALGDCWFLGAVSVCAARPDLLLKCIPESTINPYGVYEFKFFKNGNWTSVIIDDFIPLSKGRPAFASGHNPNEVWVMLMEKAYAKLHKCYEELEGGSEIYGLVDLTGGAPDTLEMDGADGSSKISTNKLWEEMLHASQQGTLMGCASVNPEAETEGDNGFGIMMNHAYGLLELQSVHGVQLIRMRNPWGMGEWTGPWSDGSREWSKDIQLRLKYEFGDDGTFWMDFKDWAKHYNRLYYLRNFGRDWQMSLLRGEWLGITAGGCGNFPTFKNNPQVAFHLDKKCTVFITLMQFDHRMLGKADEDTEIGFLLGRTSDMNTKIQTLTMANVVGQTDFNASREISKEFTLDSGTYAIIPSSFYAGKETTWILRVYVQTDEQVELIEIGTGRSSKEKAQTKITPADHLKSGKSRSPRQDHPRSSTAKIEPSVAQSTDFSQRVKLPNTQSPRSSQRKSNANHENYPASVSYNNFVDTSKQTEHHNPPKHYVERSLADDLGRSLVITPRGRPSTRHETLNSVTALQSELSNILSDKSGLTPDAQSARASISTTLARSLKKNAESPGLRRRAVSILTPTDFSFAMSQLDYRPPQISGDHLSSLEGELAELEALSHGALSSGRTRDEAGFVFKMGNLCDAAGKLETAIGYFHKFLAISKELGDSLAEALACNHLGVDLQHLGGIENLRLAIKFHTRHDELHNDPGSRFISNCNLGISFILVEDYTTAVTYFRQALGFATQNNDLEAQNLVYEYLALSAVKQREFAVAKVYLERRLRILENLGDRSGTVMLHHQIGELLMAWRGAFEEDAKNHFQLAVSLLKEESSSPDRRKMMQTSDLLQMSEPRRKMQSGQKEKTREEKTEKVMSPKGFKLPLHKTSEEPIIHTRNSVRASADVKMSRESPSLEDDVVNYDSDVERELDFKNEIDVRIAKKKFERR
ncbi:hypothetical protein PROFUN_08665 [Planoprotostelium fungivorum]|uniref:Calpain catalytic domain-containing protein n=1 Tax=Planoprotostelium fungivorum TaxID=1890364 RepID=A0A2P6NJ62_9EUKA|nr:hypothetical protein PROFUN_08665 [Planoprotostelium fungivorum]